jgi:hypothetical protein
MFGSQKEYELYSGLLLKSTFEEINISMISTINDETSVNSKYSLLNVSNSNNETLNQYFQIENKNIKNPTNQMKKDLYFEEKFLKNFF